MNCIIKIKNQNEIRRTKFHKNYIHWKFTYFLNVFSES